MLYTFVHFCTVLYILYIFKILFTFLNILYTVCAGVAELVHFRSAPGVNKVPGRFDPPVTVIMLSPRVTGASRHVGSASG